MTKSESSVTPCREPALQGLLGSWELGLLADEEALRVEAHVLSCDACFEDVHANARVAEGLRSRAVGRGAAPRPSVSRRRGGHRSRLLAALAASVLLVAVLGVLAPWDAGEDESPSTRGPEAAAPGRVLAPIGEVALPERLDWAPVPSAHEYRVRISTSRGLLAWETTVEAPPAELPRDAREALIPGATYYWQFEAVGDEGVLAKSPLTGFSVER